jgi:hypothetical protein
LLFENRSEDFSQEKKSMSHSLAYKMTFLTLLIVAAFPARAQDDEDKEDETRKSVAAFEWRNIGPANMMGRIAAIDGLNTDYRTVLVGSASGGVYKSTNAGVTWESIFDDYGSQSIGDVAFFQGDPDTIWIGTGESTNRNRVMVSTSLQTLVRHLRTWD